MIQMSQQHASHATSHTAHPKSQVPKAASHPTWHAPLVKLQSAPQVALVAEQSPRQTSMSSWFWHSSAETATGASNAPHANMASVNSDLTLDLRIMLPSSSRDSFSRRR
jgi:hypothetical protein